MLKAILAWTLALLTDSTSFVWDVFVSMPWDKLAQFAAFVYSVKLILAERKKRIAKKEKQDGAE